MKYNTNMPVSYNGQTVILSPTDTDFLNRTISLTGEIDDDMAAIVNSHLRALARDSNEDIVMYIMSPGGSVSAGFSIYDTVKALGCDVATVVTGMAASMGAFLAAAAGTKNKRYIQPHAEILIHQPLGGIQGQAADIKIHAEHILTTKDRLNRILSEVTGQSLDIIEADTDRDTIMDASQAVEYGLADTIGDPFTQQ